VVSIAQSIQRGHIRLNHIRLNRLLGSSKTLKIRGACIMGGKE